jgi:hypothetical protein
MSEDRLKKPLSGMAAPRSHAPRGNAYPTSNQPLHSTQQQGFKAKAHGE